MDKIFLIGHRGVGKTTLLQNLNENLVEDIKTKSKKYICFDLDQEIESRAQIKIKDLFDTGQVSKFRDLETKILIEIINDFESNKSKKLNQVQLIVSLGAGFDLENFKFPNESMILWIRRVTDSNGRIFLNRPALTKQSDPLQEWSEIFEIREKKYKLNSNAQVYIPEYFDPNYNALYEYLNFKSPNHGFVTYLPGENDLILDLNANALELRSDLLSEKQMFEILKSKPNTNIQHLVSIRNVKSSFLKKLFSLNANILVDWDIALGFPSEDQLRHIDIYSSHSDGAIEDILNFNFELLKRYPTKIKKLKYNPHFKICPLVSSHEEVLSLDLILSQNFDQSSYSFLPRSTSNSYDLSYFRQLKSYSQKIGFYRFGEGSSPDQPLWWQWPKYTPKGFYGIYGQNIKHSYTPSFHFDFFRRRHLWPLSIDSVNQLLVYKDQLIKNNVKALAVTAPYKLEVYLESNFKKLSSNSITEKSNLDQDSSLECKSDFKSANTLILNPKIRNKDSILKNSKMKNNKFTDKNINLVDSYNTDYFALKLFLKNHLNPKQISLVWGGGALLEQLKVLIPKAQFYSARTGKVRSMEGVALKKSDVKVQLIWASGEKGLNPDVLNQKYTITKIIDLDYRDNSKAKLYSFVNKIEYVSGLEFFIHQAQAQQSIWENYEF